MSRKKSICTMGLFNKPFKKAGFLLAFFSFFILTAQNNRTKIAEGVFDRYHKLGIFGSASILFFANEPNAVNLHYNNAKAFSYGLNYNFLQTGNFNFKVGAMKRTYNVVTTEKIRAEDVDSPFDVGGKFFFGTFTQYLFPLTAEYFLPINKKLTFSMGLGPEFTYYPEGTLYGVSFYTLEDGTQVGYTEVGNPKEGGFYIGVNASVGLNIEAGFLLLRPVFTFHYQPETLFTHTVTTQNLQVSENTVSKHEVTGNYIMLGLSISLKRGLFKRKNKQ